MAFSFPLSMDFLFLERVFFTDLKLSYKRLALYQELLAKGKKTAAIFMTSEAVSLASTKLDPQFNTLQQQYLELASQYGFELLVCGRAFKDRGYDNSDLVAGFTLSGNMEMLALALRASHVLEL